MKRQLDPDTWEAPALPPGRVGRGVRGALAGSRLYEQPEHQAFAQEIRTFLARPGPAALDVGIDHGMRFVDHARRFPEVTWLGCEIRRDRVAALQPHLPANARAVRADARTLLHAVIPPGRLDWIYVLFPSPSNDPRHVLVTPGFVDDARNALAPGGAVHLATDVPGMAQWIERCFAGWTHADPPPTGPVQTRRERVCARDGRRVWRWSIRVPDVQVDRR
jgi:tRNA G46 methylase TrmB